ncbi:MAG TPA: LAGLIDADG family homing endonuclease, partial [Candidatus Tyrphobacter sp.]
MKFRRIYSASGDPYFGLTFEPRTSRIVDPDGTVIFEAANVMVPSGWSQVAVDVLAQKYCRKAGVPRALRRVPEERVPEWLQRSIADDEALSKRSRNEQFGGELDAREVFNRLAGCWTYWGWKHDYFDAEDDARVYYDEMCAMLARQIGAPNSPQWFNTGLHWAYGISGPAQGHWYVDPKSGQLERSTSAYEHPAPHACLPYWANVSTPDGPIPIGRIVENQLLGLEVYDARGTTRVVAAKRTGVKPVLRVHLASGDYIEATSDHRVYSQLGEAARWRQIGDLQAGDVLFARGGLDPTPLFFPRIALHAGGVSTQKALEIHALEIVAIDQLPQPLPVYDIETESHSFLTNNVVVHNCFIQSVDDDLVNEGGIMDLWVREARIFKFGSGTGSNFSKLRGVGERLSGGGTSSGLMSFLRVGDRAAGAIKSGGTTRRAAKMVVLDLDHPDIEQFIGWKVKEEQKVSDLVAGSIAVQKHLNAMMRAAHDPSVPEGARLDPALNASLRAALRSAIVAGIPPANVQYAIDFAKQGYTSLEIDTYDVNWDGDAYGTVSGQNSNNSVRVPNEFFRALDSGGSWDLIRRTDGGVARSIPAAELWEHIGVAAWQCADPGVQFDTTINEWHTCPSDGRINASNPCSEYLFLDDTACFAPETRISTPDGLRTVEELFHIQERGDQVFVTTDIHSEGDHRRITAHRPAYMSRLGKRQIFKMTLKDGRVIRTTGDHRFLTHEGAWKRVDALEPGVDRIEIRESGNAVAYTSTPKDVKRWQMLGWLTGDGVFSKDTVALVFGPKERRTAEIFQPELNALKSVAAGGAVARTVNISTQANGVHQMTTSQTSLVEHLENSYGFQQGTATSKDVPESVHRVPDDLKIAYLQGLFSADGSILENPSGTEPEVMLASSAPALLRSVQLLLSDLGMTSRIGWTHPNGRKNPQGQLRLYNQQARSFMALIGFPCSAEKDVKADEVRWRSFDGALKNPRAPKILSIVPDGDAVVYDITEPVTHSVIAEGMIAHNCNLASLNLVTFQDERGEFDAKRFAEACRIWTFTLEVSVLMAQFPSRVIAQKSFDFRTLGLGYANLGTLLMRMGLPYDSLYALDWCGAITSLMTGAAYRCSAEMARQLGAFPRYGENADDMLRVIRNHRRAAYQAKSEEYEGLTIVPEMQTPTLFTQKTWDLARKMWDEALATGEVAGYRNAQTTVIAPTGTIALVMNCDTTGIEPDFALVKFKKLAGGGYFKIVNESVEHALRRLGYPDDQIAAIETYAKGTGSLEEAPHVNRATLRAKGFEDDELARIEAALPTAFELPFAFNRFVLGDEFCNNKLGLTQEQLGDWNFSILRDGLGFTTQQIEEASAHICGRMTLEGAPYLKDEHLPVFDCATPCGRYGTRFIRPLAHIDMLAA